MGRLFSYDGPVMGALMKLGDCICASALWLVFSIPIITVGASTTALYTVCCRCIRRGEGGMWNTFWGAFRENFKRSTILWLIALLVLAVLTADVLVLRSIRLSGGAMGILYWPSLALWCVALTWDVYLAAYAARVNGSVREVLRLGFMLMLLHPIKALGVMLPLLAGLALTLMVPFMALVTPAAVFWAGSITIEKVFRLHMRPEDLEREQARDENE